MKEQMESKTLAVRVPTQVFNKFKERCDNEGFRMSEVIRLYIRCFSENTKNGPTEPLRQLMKQMLKSQGDE